MKKTIGIMTLALATTMVTYAQSFKETFDANSLEWTECAYESNSGTAIIDGGKMTIISKGETQYFNKMRKDNVTMLKIK